MSSRPASWPDWRDEAQYAPLLEADRSAFAWEWLRRSPGYRKAYRDSRVACGRTEKECRAAKWGLHRFEPPHLPIPLARPIWRHDHFPYVLNAAAEPGEAGHDLFDLARAERFATLITSSAGEEHLLLSDGMRGLRLDIVSGSLARGAVRLTYRLSGFASAEPPLVVLQRLLGFWRTGRFLPALHPREARARRWVAMLRAHDAVVAGARQREIAQWLVNLDAAGPRWRVEAPTTRSRVQRLVRGARELGEGGYVAFLGRVDRRRA